MDESKIRAKMHEILDLVLDINGMNPRRKEFTGDAPTVFFWYSGQVGDIDVSVHEKGWYPQAEADYKFDSLLRDLESDATDNLIEYLKALKDENIHWGESGVCIQDGIVTSDPKLEAEEDV